MKLRLANANDRDAVARIIRDSTNAYYTNVLSKPAIFPADSLSTTDFVDLYAALPGSHSLLCEEVDGTISGSCFYHERETHMSLGIMNVHQDFFGRGIARRLLAAITDRADELGLPLRLVSSCMNLDSYSLYTRAGFAAFEFYQDVLVAVPEAGFLVDAVGLRPATPEDIPAIEALEREISGICRGGDFAHFIANPDGHWHVSVLETSGDLHGVLASSGSQACTMIGPGFARDANSALALIKTELNQHRGRTPVILLPARFNALVSEIYALGGRNCELHVAQCRGPAKPPTGVTLPTFFPETG